MRIIYISLIVILINSCGVDREKIIGQKLDGNFLPYGNGGGYDEIFLNGVRQKVFVVFYKNKALVYIYNNDGYIVDYYFSDFISYEKVKNNRLLGSEYNKVIKKMGVPFAVYKSSEFYKEIHAEFPALQDSILVLYYQKWFWKERKEYNVSSYRVLFIFDLDGKLEEITELRSHFP
ncbi:MAG: hypothetical protein LBV17_02335 [Treponema sp.]|jgi:hypothetical protein|nr:hypothetical protein [Treponema sp.]